jgi:hypothetical protein
MKSLREKIIQHHQCKEMVIDLSPLVGEEVYGIAREMSWADRKRVLDEFNKDADEISLARAMALQVILCIYVPDEESIDVVSRRLFEEQEEDIELLSRLISKGLDEIIKPLNQLNGFKTVKEDEEEKN